MPIVLSDVLKGWFYPAGYVKRNKVITFTDKFSSGINKNHAR
jgi:hypothetical protein